MRGSPMARKGPMLAQNSSSQRAVTLNPDAKLSLSKTDRLPSLPEKMDIINRWFASCVKGRGKSYKQADINIEVISELLV